MLKLQGLFEEKNSTLVDEKKMGTPHLHQVCHISILRQLSI